MPMRRPLASSLPTDDAPMPMPRMGGGMPARPGMIGAPGNNPAPGMPGPESGAMGGAMGMQVPPPIQPTGGGPTSPMNIGSMLQPDQTMGQPGQPGGQTPRTPLPPYGDSQGTPPFTGMADSSPAGVGQYGDVDAGPADAQGNSYMSGQKGSEIHAGSPSLVMLRMMHALGKLGG